ncbi:MAG: hypothetical protein WCP28_19375 [Actinomycetes bacterium]
MTIFFEDPLPQSSVAVADPEVPAEIGSPEDDRNVKKAALIILGAIALILLLVFLWYLFFRKPLQLPGMGDNRIPSFSANFYGSNAPMGVAVDPAADRVYVTSSAGTADTGVFDRNGQQLGALAPPDTKTAHVPVYVAVNPTNSDVYVTDRSTREIYIYDNTGQFLRTYAPAGDLKKTWQPLAVAFDKDGNLYISDVNDPQKILEFGADGNVIREIGTPGMTTFANAIAIDDAKNVIVSDSNNGRVLFFAPDNTLITQINRGSGASELSMPRGLVVSGSRLFVVDTVNMQVQNYDIKDLSSSGPRYIGAFGTEGVIDGTFSYPNGLAVDDQGRVFVTDRVNNRVTVWSW